MTTTTTSIYRGGGGWTKKKTTGSSSSLLLLGRRQISRERKKKRRRKHHPLLHIMYGKKYSIHCTHLSKKSFFFSNPSSLQSQEYASHINRRDFEAT